MRLHRYGFYSVMILVSVGMIYSFDAKLIHYKAMT